MCGVMETWPRANEGKVTLKTTLGKINLNGNLETENQLLYKWVILKIRFQYWKMFLKAVYVYVAETTVSLQTCFQCYVPLFTLLPIPLRQATGVKQRGGKGRRGWREEQERPTSSHVLGIGKRSDGTLPINTSAAACFSPLLLLIFFKFRCWKIPLRINCKQHSRFRFATEWNHRCQGYKQNLRHHPLILQVSELKPRDVSRSWSHVDNSSLFTIAGLLFFLGTELGQPSQLPLQLSMVMEYVHMGCVPLSG